MKKNFIIVWPMQEKLKSIGIKTPQELADITKRSYDMALKVWTGKIPLSSKMAKAIKNHTGASLDFLLN